MKFLIVIFVIFCNVLQAQKHDNVWLIGRETTSSSILNFSSGTMQVDSIVRNMPFHREAITMSDSLGNLLFYTNGIKINNNQHQLIQNGDSLNPGQVANSWQNYGYVIPNGLISIAHPIENNKYYIFHQSISSSSNLGEYLYFSLIDMNANNGLGKVELKNQILTSDSLAIGQLQMVKHANGRDWWLLQAMFGTNGFHTFLITGDSIIYAHKQYIGNNNRIGGSEWTGQSVFSPNGSKYARYDVSNDLDIFDFDRCTGLFSNPIHINIQDTFDMATGATHGGIAISPSNQYLYVSSYYLVYQFDLWASNIALSKDTVAVFDGFIPGAFPSYPTVFNVLMSAPDNKIYGLCHNEKYLHVINNPNVGGVNCNVQQHSINLPVKNTLMFPNFPHYRTPALSGSPCDTLTSVAAIAAETDIKLYPNPTSSSITIESAQPIQQITVYNALGQEVMNKLPKQQNIVELETNQLENGSYFVKIGIDNRFITKQFVVLR